MHADLFFVCVLLQVLSDYGGTLVINASQAYFHFCEFPVLPVAVYPFNNKTLANDVSNKGKGKTLGTTFSSGINGEPGGSIEVHGHKDSHITLYNTNDILDTKVSITILLYVYPLGSGGPIVNYKIDGHGVQMYSRDGGGSLGLGARINPRDSSSLGSEVLKAEILQTNKWQFIGVTYNGSSRMVKLWHDGRDVASLSQPSTAQIATQYNVRVGARESDYFHGRVACLQFYSTALTQRQIDKARTACKPFEPVSMIRIVVEHKNKYIEENETVTIKVSNDKNVTFSEYKYELGDGSPVVITDQDLIHHKYSRYGVFTVAAIMYSRCRNETLNVSTPVPVEKPVQLLGKLTLSCDPVPFPAPLSVVLISDRGTDFKCNWRFSDGHQTETDFVDHGSTHNLTYSFNATGNYSLDVDCVNRLSKANITRQVIVQAPVQGLVIEKITPKVYLEEFKITWHVQSGSDIYYTANFAGQELEAFKSLNDTHGWAWVRGDNNLGPGMHDVIITATNQVSRILNATETVRIEKQVKPFSPVLFHSTRDIEVNETLVLFMTNINKENGVHPIYSIDLRDGRGVIKTRSLKTNVTFSNYGDFVITINASNNVSFYNASVSIKVYKPVLLLEYLNLTTEPTVFLQPTIVTVSMGRVSDVVCNASFSDIHNYSRAFDLRGESLWDPVRKRTDGPNIPPDVTFLIKRNYTEVGVYSVTVACRNRLSEKTATIDVTVQEPVTGAHWIPNAAIIFGNPINITLEITSGTNASFEVSFNGHRFIHKNVGLSTFHIIHQDIYHSVGVHHFIASVWNLVSPPIVILGHVIVEVPIYGLEAYLIGGPRDFEVNESVSIGTSLKKGSYPEFLFDFKDGSEVMVTQNHAVEHKFNPHSQYMVHIIARNNVSQQVAFLNITVVKPVLPLQGILINSSPAAVNKTAKLVLGLSEGSDFSCHWQFGDGSSLNSSYRNLSFYADGKTTDKRRFQNMIFILEHIYSSAWKFDISVHCQNRLSSKYASAQIVIQTLVKGLHITKLPIQIVGQEFKVSWSLLSGTNTTFKVIFDGEIINEIHRSKLEGFVPVVLKRPGEYIIWVEAHNLVSPTQNSSAVIVAEVPISNLTVNVTYETRDLEMDHDVTFTASVITGTNPVYSFDFGDGNKFENYLGKVTYKYSYNDVYESQPNVTYEVRVTAYNNVSSVTVSSINVTVHKPVLLLQRVKLSAYPSNVSEHARIVLTIDQGSDFHCVCKFGDGTIPREIQLTQRVFLGANRTSVEIFRNQSYPISYTYDKPLKYRLFIQCKNRLSDANSTTEIFIQEPITDLKISDIPPLRFNETLVISWEIANGTNVGFRVALANLTFHVSGDQHNITITPDNYNVAGVFQVSVVARNLVSWVVAKTTAVIQNPVYIQEVTARLPQPGEPRVSFGLRGDYFPAGRNITFEASARGTNLSYQWKIDDAKVESLSDHLLWHKFYIVGLHNLSVLVKNMVSHAHANITVKIHYAIKDPVLYSNSPQKVKQPIKFHLSAKQLGTASCFFVDFGDGYRSLYGHPECKAINRTSKFSVIPAVESVTFEHVYNQVGEYKVTINASNTVSFVKVNTDVEVALAPCTSPSIMIENLGVSSGAPSESFHYDTYTVHTNVHLNCERTNKVKFKWHLLSRDQQGNQIVHRNNIILTERELNIPRKGLKYGLYEVQFSAQMVLSDTDKYRSTAMGYLRIIPSPLVAKIEGGSLITRGFGKEIKIDATQSKDPDVDTGKDSGLRYTWLCRSVHTQFPKSVYPNMTLRSPYDRTNRPAASDTLHSKGCYGDGLFLFHGGSGLLSLNTTRMIENETYVLFLIIQKGKRVAQQYQVIEVIAGDPPVTKIECKQNCGDKINPSKRLALFASCFEGCIGRLIYEWQVYKNGGNDSTKSWQFVHDIGPSEVKDPKGPVFTVLKNVFDGASEYLIRLYSRRENGEKGKTESVLQTNEVPKGGDCFGLPPRGDALMTKFHIWCDNWTDPDTPLSYEFYYKDEKGKLILFYFGLHNSTDAELPLGDPAHNFKIEIYMKVLDKYKGEGNYSVILQSVEPQMQEDEVGDMLGNMTSGENSDLSKLVNVGDSQAALRLAGAVNSLLNAQSSKASSNNSDELNARKEKRKAVRTSVINAATSLPVTSLEGLQQSADIIASASKFKDETSSTAMNASAKAFEKMSTLLQASSEDSAGYDAVVNGAESLLSGMGYVLNAAGSSVVVTPKNATEALPTCIPYDYTCTLPDLEVANDEETVELDEESLKSRDTANNILSMLGSVSGSVLENKLEGEQPSVILTAKLNLAVERSDPNSLGGSDIGDGQAGFQMPSAGKLFANRTESPVDKQMAAMNENPYTWGKKSSDISGKVVSLSFKSKGKKLEVSNLNEDDPIDILIPRDAPVEPPKTFTYNCSVHNGWRIHKLVIDKNGTAVNVEVGVLASDRQFEVYVRRGKPPTIAEFDWWKVSPNKTDYKPSNRNLNQKYQNATEESVNAPNKESLLISTNSTKTLSNTTVKEHNVTNARPDDFKFEESKLSLFLPQTGLHVGTYYIGIKFTEMLHSSGCNFEDFNITYTLRTFKSKCLYWNEEFQKWKGDGCQVGNLTGVTQTHCRCTHLTAFASMMAVAPNPIDFSAVMDGFSSMFETGNVTVFFFILATFLIYSLVLIWARRADKKDMEQIGATPIAPNVPNANYHYELTFFTGQRSGAGTTAQVSCLLAGEREDSGICILKDDKRQTFIQGSANAFLISVPGSLGTITSLRVWHDNHGIAPAWFLKRVLVRNLQTDAITVFICERWFALEEDDGAIMRELTPATEKDLTSFSRLFNSKLYKDFTDAHLWFSVMLKPSQSTFTRAQRTSCCLCLLCTAMVTSCMFYGQTGSGDDSAKLLLGPIEINLRSVMIGVQCSLVIIPVNVVVVTIFKGVKPKGAKKTKQDSDEGSLGDTISTVDDEFSEINDTPGLKEDALKEKEVHLDCVVCEVNESCISCDNDLAKNKPSERFSNAKYWFFRNRKQKYVVQSNGIDSKSLEDGEDTSDVISDQNGKTNGCCGWWNKKKDANNKSKKKKENQGFLPYWFLYIAWPLCILTSIASALFTLFYSMQWGKEKSNQWFVSMILTFSQDTLINQPAKVLLLSVAYAIFIKKSDEEIDVQQINEDSRKGEDEEWIHLSDENGLLDKDDREIELLRYRPPDETKLSALRKTRLREKELKGKFINLGNYLFVLLVLALVSYGNRDPASFLMRNSLEQEFMHPLTASNSQGLDDVNNLPLFLKWAQQSFIPYLYEQDWYNGDKVINRTGFTYGRQSMRLGRVRLRQVRVENGSCTVPELIRKTDIIRECNPPYDKLYDDTKMYSPGWKDGTQVEGARENKRNPLGQLSPWVYMDETESNSSLTFYGRIAFYPGGGYVAEFGNTAEETTAFVTYLNRNHWIDRYTRAVYIEGAVYNPNVNLIGVMETVIEVTSANILLPKVNFMILRLYAELNPSYAFYSACEFVFFGILLYTLYTIIKGIYQRKKDYFREVVSWLDFVFFVNGIAVVVVYILRESRVKSAIEVLKNDKESFLNISECALYSEEVVFLFAFAAFIATLKFINFLSFTRCVQLLSTTIFRSVVELQSFAVMLFTIYMAYASMTTTIYAPYLEEYRSVSSTLRSLTCLVMGEFDFTKITSLTDYKDVGYFFFLSFTSSMIFVFTNIVITIINVVHKDVCDDEELKKNEGSLFNIILERLMILTGFRGPPQREEPIIEQPSISELQWNLNVQYLLDNQLKRLNALVNSIYAHDEIENMLFTNYLLREPENEHKPAPFTTEHGNHGNAADQLAECEQGLEVNADIKVNHAENTHPQSKISSTSEQQNNSIETITQLIAKKKEELRRLQEEGNCNERETLLRVKVINCLQDLLDKVTERHGSAEVLVKSEEDSKYYNR